MDASSLEQEVQRLTELNELKSKFIHAAVHQLRTPVSVVRWTVEIMLGANAKVVSDDPTIKNLQAIYKANDVIRLRVDDLLSALNIEENKVQLDKSDVQLEDTAKAVIESLSSDLQEKNITLNFVEPPEVLPKIKADAEEIKNSLQKIILNAITYSDQNGAIEVKLAQKDTVVRCEVSDNGIGVPTADQTKIFERFGRASNAASMQPSGYGLGLYIAKSFIEAHGGRIGVVSEENHGSLFWFELPLS